MLTENTYTKNARFDTRLTMEQKVLFEKAAQLGGYRNLTDFVIMTVQEKAKEIIAEKERVLASKEDSKIFFDAILNPESPNEELLQATDAFNKLLR